MSVRPAKTQSSLGNRPVWSESSLSAWRKLGSLATHWAHSEESRLTVFPDQDQDSLLVKRRNDNHSPGYFDQTGRMLRLILVFAGRTVTLLVLSCRGSINRLCSQTCSVCMGNFYLEYQYTYLYFPIRRCPWNSINYVEQCSIYLFWR